MKKEIKFIISIFKILNYRFFSMRKGLTFISKIRIFIQVIKRNTIQ